MSTERTCLVTGAAGFVGAALVRQLVAAGWRVAGADRSAVPAERVVAGTDVHLIDVRDIEALLHLMGRLKPAVVFHLAAQACVPVSVTEPYPTVLDNVAGTAAVLEACRRTAVQRVVFASSGAVYGAEPGAHVYGEDSPMLVSANLYGPSKIAAELVAQGYAQTFQLDVRIGRFMNTYGPGDLNETRIIPTAIRLALHGLPYDFGPRDDGTTTLDFVHVDDVVAGYIALATTTAGPAATVYNFGADRGVQLRHLVTMISQLVDGRVRDAVFSGPPAAVPRSKKLDSTGAAKVLGWRPRVGLSEGLAATVAWHRERLAR